MKEQTIVLTSSDHARLIDLIAQREYKKERHDADAFKRLSAELERAQLVTAEEIPADVVTVNTTIRVRDMEDKEDMTFTLSWPEYADSSAGRINVLAPLGMALLGSRVGEEIKWEVPNGIRKLQIKEILFQPESDNVTS